MGGRKISEHAEKIGVIVFGKGPARKVSGTANEVTTIVYRITATAPWIRIWWLKPERSQVL